MGGGHIRNKETLRGQVDLLRRNKPAENIDMLIKTLQSQ